MSLINIQNLTFSYEGSHDDVFTDVSFQLDSDWKLGFTGRNGRGKTTFLRLLRGELEYRGKITASVAFDSFPFDIKDTGAYPVEIAESILPDYEEWRFLRETALLDVTEDALYRPYSTLSNGERTKIQLAILFLKDNSFLLIDEPTNHLDLDGRATVAKYLNKKKGFIVVSHDRAFLDDCTDHTLSIDKTKIVVQKGSYSSYLQNKRLEDEFELAKNEKLKGEISRLKTAAKRTSEWSDKLEKTKYHPPDDAAHFDRGHIGAQAAKMMKRSKATETRILKSAEEKAKLLKNIEKADSIKITPLVYHSQYVVRLDNITIEYDSRIVVDGLDLEVRQGQIVAITGANGCGKSSVLKYALNHLPKLKISYVPQDTSALNGYIRDFSDDTKFYTLLDKLDFPKKYFDRRSETLSEGQKKKILLAKSLSESAHLYIWDEPLNYVDVISREQIENMLKECSPTMLIVEHDRYFLENIGAEILSL